MSDYDKLKQENEALKQTNTDLRASRDKLRITHELTKALPDAYNVEQAISILGEDARVEDGRVVFGDGQTVLERVDEARKKAPNLFRENVDLKQAPRDADDVANLSTDQFMKLYREHPERLGVRKNTRI